MITSLLLPLVAVLACEYRSVSLIPGLHDPALVLDRLWYVNMEGELSPKVLVTFGDIR